LFEAARKSLGDEGMFAHCMRHFLDSCVTSVYIYICIVSSLYTRLYLYVLRCAVSSSVFGMGVNRCGMDRNDSKLV
jgi:hypothetical protein